MSQQQATLAQLSQMVCYAYGAYTDTCDNGTDPTQAILNLAPSLMNVVPIFVYEHPNDVAVPPIPTAKGSHISGVAETSDWDSANNTIQGLSCGPAPSQTSTGYQLFGFTATVPASNTVPEMNVLALRGTVTTYEASVSLIGWSTDWLPTPAVLPTSGSGQQYGLVNASYWYFYQGGYWEDETSLAESIQSAVSATSAASSAPWYAAAHSLGGGMLSLGVLDAYLAGCFGSQIIQIATFASVLVGNSDFAKAYTANLNIPLGPQTTRVANLCDWVPSFRGMTPGKSTTDWTHVGEGFFFVWQTDDDWGNHSLGNVYMPVMFSSQWYKNVFQAKVPVNYPVGIEKFGQIKG